MFKVALKDTTTMYYTICTMVVLEICDNNDLQFNRHAFRGQFLSWKRA